MRPAWAVGVLLVVGIAASTPPQQETDVIKKMFQDAEGIKATKRALSKDARERIEKALGAKIEDKIPTVWEARATVSGVQGGEKTRVYYVAVTAKGSKGDIRVGVAVAVEERIVAALKILDNKDDKAVESREFLEQFQGFEYAEPGKPIASLEDAKKKAGEAKDDAAKELAAFFTFAEKMHGIQAGQDRVEPRVEKEEDGGAADEAAKMQKTFGEVTKLLPQFKTFLSGSQIDRLTTQMKDSEKTAGQLADALKGKRWADARKLSHDLAHKCDVCHTMRTKFRERRATIGIGNGFFVIGHEIAGRPPDGPRDSFQAVATAVRKAVLIVTEAR